MRVLFAGSPAIAVPAFEALCREQGIEVAGVLTNPDTAQGRHAAALPTQVAQAAARVSPSLPILKSLKLDADIKRQTAALAPDLLISFAYGRLFSEEYLAVFPLGGINIHPSLLPKYRGPTPIQAAILNRDAQTGITVQKLAKELDCGDIFAQEQVQLTGRETTAALSEVMAQKAAVLLPGVLKSIAAGAAGIPQNHGEASFCSKITTEDGLIDWNKSQADIDAMIRAFDPWPLCRTIHKGRELLLLKADVYSGSQERQGLPGQVLGIDKQCGILIQTGEGILAVTQLQYQAKKALEWRDFLNGARDFTGSVLTMRCC